MMFLLHYNNGFLFFMAHNLIYDKKNRENITTLIGLQVVVTHEP